MNNLILHADSYKYSHYLQYPPGTTYISSYIEPRGVDKNGLFSFWLDRSGIREGADEVVNFGLGAYIQEYLTNPITKADIEEAAELLAPHGEPFNREGYKELVDKYGGFVPMKIEALPEGTIMPLRTCQVQFVNTDPKFAWLTSMLETTAHRAIWYGSTVATLSRECKKVIYKFLKKTSDFPDENIPFKLHDFGGRGASSGETAMLGGMAHLVNFMGTDTIEAIVGARKYYNEPMAGYSIPAAEHSTITAWGEDHEEDAYLNMLTQFGGPGKIVAVVSDSYNIYNSVENIWGGSLKDAVIQNGGTLVIRPDSGDPLIVVPKIMELLGVKFEFEVNTKGYKVLPKYLRVIQGDGVNYHSITSILEALEKAGWSTENIAFGMGGALLQKVNRDDLMYAMKANAKCVNGVWTDVYKKPVDDPEKQSKAGILAVYKPKDGRLKTVRKEALWIQENLLQTYYINGSWHSDDLKTIRERAKL